MKIVVKYLNLVFQFIKNTKWHLGYTDCRARLNVAQKERLIYKSLLIHKVSFILYTKT